MDSDGSPKRSVQYMGGGVPCPNLLYCLDLIQGGK